MKEEINDLSKLTPGEVYEIYCKQFDVTNRARFICGDTTDMNREIGYFQFSDRGYNPVINKEHLRAIFDGKAHDVYTLFALWQHDLKHNTITKTI